MLVDWSVGLSVIFPKMAENSMFLSEDLLIYKRHQRTTSTLCAGPRRLSRLHQLTRVWRDSQLHEAEKTAGSGRNICPVAQSSVKWPHHIHMLIEISFDKLFSTYYFVLMYKYHSVLISSKLIICYINYFFITTNFAFIFLWLHICIACILVC